MLKNEDIKHFFADNINYDDYLIETYVFETTIDPKIAAASLASEQSTAQWARPGVDEDYRSKHGAKVIELTVIEESKNARYPTDIKSGNFKTCWAQIANPIINFGAKLPNILTAVAGEGAFYSPGITSIELVDLKFPNKILSKFKGPKFGVKGFRDLLKINDRPLFFGVVKPNVGLPATDFANIAYEAWAGGLDVAKDDEMLADSKYSTLEDRVKLCTKMRKKAEDETGMPKMFLANITDEVEEMPHLLDVAVKNGANSVMINVFTVGLSATRWISKLSPVPVVAHFDFIAPFTRIPKFGLTNTLVTKLQRLSGCDAIIMPGFGERMRTTEQEVKENVTECLMNWDHIKPTLPVPGGSDSAVTLPLMYEKLKTIDFACVPGRGVFGHPSGPRAGAKSLVQAWDAISKGVDIKDAAKDFKELDEAIKTFGS